MAGRGRRRSVDVVVVGAGQAGLIASWFLRQAGREHLLLDRRATLGGGWQDRWDAFRLVSPNWTTTVPGFPYRGDDPDGFMPRDEVIEHWRAYAAAIDAPVELDTDVTRLVAADGRGATRFRLTTSRSEVDAAEVVVAGGPFQRPFIPPIAGGFDPSIQQVHAHDYRRPEQLPSGGVLLVGSGQTGVQLAEELTAAGRPVTIAVGHCGRGPRTYRGHDLFWWLRQLATRGREVGAPLPTPETLPDPRGRLGCNVHLSGHAGGHDTNLRRMAAEGIRLVGRLEGAEGTRARFADDLGENLRYADTFFLQRFAPICQAFVERTAIDVPDGAMEQFDFEPPVIRELDLAAEGIGSVLWTSGYRLAFEWIQLEEPVIDELGFPITDGGRTPVPGLSFLGTPWLVDMGSGNLVAVARDAEALAAEW